MTPLGPTADPAQSVRFQTEQGLSTYTGIGSDLQDESEFMLRVKRPCRLFPFRSLNPAYDTIIASTIACISTPRGTGTPTDT